MKKKSKQMDDQQLNEFFKDATAEQLKEILSRAKKEIAEKNNKRPLSNRVTKLRRPPQT